MWEHDGCDRAAQLPVAVLEPGATSWTGIVDALRLGPEDDATAVTVEQLLGVFGGLMTAGQWQSGDPDFTIVMDAGYVVTRLAWVLPDLSVELVGRIRRDWVMRLPKPPRVHDHKGGWPPNQRPESRFARPETWPEPAVVTPTDTANYGKAASRAWAHAHPG